MGCALGALFKSQILKSWDYKQGPRRPWDHCLRVRRMLCCGEVSSGRLRRIGGQKIDRG